MQRKPALPDRRTWPRLTVRDRLAQTSPVPWHKGRTANDVRRAQSEAAADAAEAVKPKVLGPADLERAIEERKQKLHAERERRNVERKRAIGLIR